MFCSRFHVELYFHFRLREWNLPLDSPLFVNGLSYSHYNVIDFILPDIIALLKNYPLEPFPRRNVLLLPNTKKRRTFVRSSVTFCLSPQAFYGYLIFLTILCPQLILNTYSAAVHIATVRCCYYTIASEEFCTTHNHWRAISS